MENKSQTSVEYLVMLGLVMIIATLAIVLTTRLLDMKDNLVATIKEFRSTILQIE